MDSLSDKWKSLRSRLRVLWYRSRGLICDGSAWVQAIEIHGPPASIRLGDGCALDRGVTLLVVGDARPGMLTLGARCYVNRGTMFDVSESLTIGEDSMIGPFCYITDHDHSVGPGQRPADGALVASPVRIGARCWIGAKVTVLKGVTIGDGAVIGAGSVVTRSVPAECIAVGNPARAIRQIT